MHKYFTRIVALELIFALVADPVTAVMRAATCATPHTRRPTQYEQFLIASQALGPRATAFREGTLAPEALRPWEWTLANLRKQMEQEVGFQLERDEEQKLRSDLKMYGNVSASSLWARLRNIDGLLADMGFENAYSRHRFVIAHHQRFNTDMECQWVRDWLEGVKVAGRTIPLQPLLNAIETHVVNVPLVAELREVDKRHGFRELSAEEIRLLNSDEFGSVPSYGAIRISFAKAKGKALIRSYEDLRQLLLKADHSPRKRKRAIVEQRISVIRKRMAKYFEKKKEEGSNTHGTVAMAPNTPEAKRFWKSWNAAQNIIIDYSTPSKGRRSWSRYHRLINKAYRIATQIVPEQEMKYFKDVIEDVLDQLEKPGVDAIAVLKELRRSHEGKRLKGRQVFVAAHPQVFRYSTDRLKLMDPTEGDLLRLGKAYDNWLNAALMELEVTIEASGISLTREVMNGILTQKILELHGAHNQDVLDGTKGGPMAMAWTPFANRGGAFPNELMPSRIDLISLLVHMRGELSAQNSGQEDLFSAAHHVIAAYSEKASLNSRHFMLERCLELMNHRWEMQGMVGKMTEAQWGELESLRALSSFSPWPNHGRIVALFLALYQNLTNSLGTLTLEKNPVLVSAMQAAEKIIAEAKGSVSWDDAKVFFHLGGPVAQDILGLRVLTIGISVLEDDLPQRITTLQGTPWSFARFSNPSRGQYEILYTHGTGGSA